MVSSSLQLGKVDESNEEAVGEIPSSNSLENSVGKGESKKLRMEGVSTSIDQSLSVTLALEAGTSEPVVDVVSSLPASDSKTSGQ